MSDKCIWILGGMLTQLDRHNFFGFQECI